MAITKPFAGGLLMLAASLSAPGLHAGTVAAGHEHARYAWGGRAEIDQRSAGDSRWEARLWAGDDRNRLLLRSEGERHDGRTESAELWALASHNVSMFWDVQAGLRADTAAGSEQYAVIGIEGLAPYFFDSELHAFIDRDGDVSMRAHQSVDVLVTQKLILQPRLELNAGLQDEQDSRQGHGLRSSEAGLRLRYELRREFAPYVEWVRERAHGGSADYRRADGEDTGDSSWRLGVMLRF